MHSASSLTIHQKIAHLNYEYRKLNVRFVYVFSREQVEVMNGKNLWFSMQPNELNLFYMQQQKIASYLPAK